MYEVVHAIIKMIPTEKDIDLDPARICITATEGTIRKNNAKNMIMLSRIYLAPLISALSLILRSFL